MGRRDNAPRWLGAAFLGVVVTSLVSGVLFLSAAGSGNLSDILAKVAANAMLARVSVVAAMVNCVGVLVLAALLFVVLSGQTRVIALVALGCWVGEALFYAVAWVGVAGLVPMSQDFVKAGAPDASAYQALGDFLYHGVYKLGLTIHMFFYCVGGLAWYTLLYRSRFVPRAIPVYGLAAVSVGLIGSLSGLLGNDVPMLASLPILPFELIVGAWLLVRGIEPKPARSEAPTGVASGPLPVGRS